MLQLIKSSIIELAEESMWFLGNIASVIVPVKTILIEEENLR